MHPKLGKNDTVLRPAHRRPYVWAGAIALALTFVLGAVAQKTNSAPAGVRPNQTHPRAHSSRIPTRLDFSEFKLILTRNIFDPNRRPRRSRPEPAPRRRPRRIESFALVGVMSYAKGTFAFFNGTGPEYKKALKMNDFIAGYRVAAISPNSVRLSSNGRYLDMEVGRQLSREDEGPWVMGTQNRVYADNSNSRSNGSRREQRPSGGRRGSSYPSDSSESRVATGSRSSLDSAQLEKIRERLKERREQME